MLSRAIRNRSQRITLQDMRAIGNAVQECRDLWSDPPAWQTHLMRRVTALTACRVGIYFEMADHAGVTADRILAAGDAGWEGAKERHTVVEGLAQRPLRYSPLWAAFADVLSARPSRALTARQDLVIETAAWQSSEMYDRHVRPTRLGEVTLSAVWLPRLSSWSVWSLVTDRSDPSPPPKTARLARLFHQQIAPLIGTELSTWRDRTVDALSVTRRRVLEALLDGLGEPDIARRTCRSRSAVHEQVTALYRHFGVNSRGELGAFFLRRRAIPADRAVQIPSTNDWLDQPWGGMTE